MLLNKLNGIKSIGYVRNFITLVLQKDYLLLQTLNLIIYPQYFDGRHNTIIAVIQIQNGFPGINLFHYPFPFSSLYFCAVGNSRFNNSKTKDAGKKKDHQ